MSPKFNTDERLDEAKQRGVGVDMPVPLHERIDQLCDLVYNAGNARPSKRKMLAALVLAAPADVDDLDRMLRDYDRARVADALVEAPLDDGTVVEFPRRKRGPRSRPMK